MARITLAVIAALGGCAERPDGRPDLPVLASADDIGGSRAGGRMPGPGGDPMEGREGSTEGEGEPPGGVGEEGEGERAGAEGEGEGEGERAGAEGEGEAPLGWQFPGASRATTDGPGTVTVWWTVAVDPGDPDASFDYLLYVGFDPEGPDPGGPTHAIVRDGGVRHTLTRLPEGRRANVLVRARDAAHRTDDNQQIVSAPTSLLDVPYDPVFTWQQPLDYGGLSSIALGDFDSDGVLDMVRGAGADGRFGAVFALSGVDGHQIWLTETDDEMVGSPLVMDINDDDVPDVIIGGRQAMLLALDGRTGQQIWSFAAEAWVSTPLRAPDDPDGRAQIVVGSGGTGSLGEHHEIPPGDEEWQAGRAHLLRAADGTMVSRHLSPNDEYYASPAIGDLDGDGSPEVVIGAGGHEDAGEVIVFGLEGWERRWGQPSGVAGFLASPSLADLDGDGLLDIVIGSSDQFVGAYRGRDGEPLWFWSQPGFEVLASTAVGWVRRGEGPAVAIAASEGGWRQRYLSSKVAVVRGDTGEELWSRQDDLGMVRSTPLMVDLTGNGLDDVIFNQNIMDIRDGQPPGRILLLHGATGEPLAAPIIHRVGAGPTPIVADLDGDGDLELLFSGPSRNPALSFGPGDPPDDGEPVGMAYRVDLNVAVPAEGLSWPGFRGGRLNRGQIGRPAPR